MPDSSAEARVGSGPGTLRAAHPSGPDALHDEATELELQNRLDEIERSERHDPLRWLLLSVAVVFGVSLAPAAGFALAASIMGFLLGATGLGVFKVRRGQRKRAVERELDMRRTRDLRAPESPAHHLVALHDRLDRIRASPSGMRELMLSAIGAVLLVTLGLGAGGTATWATLTGVFLGLFALFRGRGVLDRRREMDELRRRIDEVGVGVDATTSE